LRKVGKLPPLLEQVPDAFLDLREKMPATVRCQKPEPLLGGDMPERGRHIQRGQIARGRAVIEPRHVNECIPVAIHKDVACEQVRAEEAGIVHLANLSREWVVSAIQVFAQRLAGCDFGNEEGEAFPQRPAVLTVCDELGSTQAGTLQHE